MNAIRKTGFFMITVLLAAGVLFASGCKEEEREYEMDPSQLVSDVLDTIQKGKYVVVCVTEDIDNAKAVINQYF